MLWHPWITLDRRIRLVLAERIERDATDELDRKLADLIVAQAGSRAGGWFS